MTQVQQAPTSPIPTPARVVNGSLSGAAAQIVGNAATGALVAHGLDPMTATMVGGAVGSAASGGLAVVGSWSRDVLAQIPPGPWWSLARLPFMLLGVVG